MASLTVNLAVRTRGLWRLRLVAALLRVSVYIPGSFDWAARGLRVEYRVEGGRWRDAGATFHLS